MLKLITIRLFILFLLLIQFSCTSNRSKQEELYKEIISTHDEVMPKMEEVSSLSKKLKEKSAILEQENEEKERNLQIKKSITALENASLSMMDWMRKFNSSYDTLPEEVADNYLKEERLKIQKVKAEMNKAIEEAKKQI